MKRNIVVQRLMSLFLFVFIFIVSGMMVSRVSQAFDYHIGGRKLYQLGFIQGLNPDKRVLNENVQLTREQLALLILEIIGLKEEALKARIEPNYSDAAEISKWARPYVAYCQKINLMSGIGHNRFQPKGYVTGKQLGAVLLRALGYTRESGREVAWSDVEVTFEKFGLPITSWMYHSGVADLSTKNLNRGDAYDLIWYTITYPLCADGEVLAMKLGKIKPREVIFFGEYEQDGNLENGKEPIEWIILEKREGKALVTSRYGLDSKRYHDDYIDWEEMMQGEGISWKESSIRKWLNQEFYCSAFRGDEQKRIRLSHVENSIGTTKKDTSDRIFLLSNEDVDKYFVSDYDRCLIATSYVVNKSGETGKIKPEYRVYGNCTWTLRDIAVGIYGVLGNGMGVGGPNWSGTMNVNSKGFVIRPAMWIELDF